MLRLRMLENLFQKGDKIGLFKIQKVDGRTVLTILGVKIKYKKKTLKQYFLAMTAKMFLNIYKKYFLSIKSYGLNKKIFQTVAGGIGILNYKDSIISGEYNFLNKYLKTVKSKDVVIFDIGANIGEYSKMCSGVLPASDIYAFEPNPITFEKLKNNITEKSIKIFNYGLNDIELETFIYDNADSDAGGHASIFKEVLSDIHKYEKVNEIPIKLRKFDDFIQENNIQKIDLLKIDTEGNEFKILQGAKNSLDKGVVSCIHFEFNEMNVVSRSFMNDFIVLLKDYKLYRLLPDGFAPLENESVFIRELFAFQNIIAIRNDYEDKSFLQ